MIIQSGDALSSQNQKCPCFTFKPDQTRYLWCQSNATTRICNCNKILESDPRDPKAAINVSFFQQRYRVFRYRIKTLLTEHSLVICQVGCTAPSERPPHSRRSPREARASSETKSRTSFSPPPAARLLSSENYRCSRRFPSTANVSAKFLIPWASSNT